LLGLGIAIFVFVFLARALDWRLGPFLGFFENNLFLPIILVLVGRGMMRRSRQQGPSTVAIPRQPRPPAPPPRPRPVEPPAYQIPDFPELTPAPAPPAPAPTPQPTPRQTPTPHRPATEPTRPVAGPAKPGAESHHGKSSEEMIAEAKRRLGDRRS
jgi:hypothetical protein